MGPNCCFSFINRFRRIICICIGVLNMMGPNCLFNFIDRFRRIICICIGVLSMAPWIFLSYVFAAYLVLLDLFSAGHWADGNGATLPVSIFVCLLASIVFSALMVFGAIRRSAICILPWLAIHFVMGMVTNAMVFWNIVFFVICEDKQSVIIPMVLSTLGSGALTISWCIVYPYFKYLVVSTQMQPTCLKEDRLLKTRNETEEQTV